jgi:replicative DNA helicase
MQDRSEKLIINCVITDSESLHEIMSKINSSMFKDLEHRKVFALISSLYAKQQTIDLITLYKEAKETLKSKADKKNIPILLSELTSMFSYMEKKQLPSAINVLVSENIRHEHVSLSQEILTMANSDEYNPKDVLDVVQSHIADNKYKAIINKKDFTNSELLDELDRRMISAADSGGINGIRTGYERYDEITSGMQPTNLIIVAARPAMGKTQFALGLMANASVRNQHKGLFISCEMDEVQVMKRIIAVHGGIAGYSIKYGKLQRSEVTRYSRAKDDIKESSLKIVAGSFTISEVMSLVYKEKYSHGLDYVIVDYIQKIQAPGSQNRTNEVGEVSRRLKDMANELKIPVIALAQLSRAVEHRTDKKPMLSDLRESGDIEQDADIVAFLYRAGYYMDPEEKESNPMAEDGYIIIAKHRDGDLEDIPMRFDSDIPAWKNQNETEPVFTQSSLKPNVDFTGSQPF